MQSNLSITDHHLMSNVVRWRANSQYSTTILCRVLLDAAQTLKNRPLSYVECCQMQSKLSITDLCLISNVVRCRANSQQQTTFMSSVRAKLSITYNFLISSIVRCKLSITGNYLSKLSTFLTDLSISSMSRCCQMQSKLSITDHYLMSSVVRCRGNCQ